MVHVNSNTARVMRLLIYLNFTDLCVQRAIMALSIVLLIASAACSLLSLDCVLMTDRKNVMALSSGIIAVSAGKEAQTIPFD